MTGPKILVDSSVWIDFFKSTKSSPLSIYLEEDIVFTNELILTELTPWLHQDKKWAAIESLNALESIPLSIDWEIIRQIQQLNLKNGINKVGIPDLIIINQVIEEKLVLFSHDKHFKLMQEILKFDLIT